ncbi:hypothetical protein PPYR_01361 [Photinus pyralis]|uniref:MULE transposase domain-containing protein n=1 Tax=Photinus pyralis TaxID=7054 RepID=A0A5N4B447_PHOPY|nr:hypothetical protein PPYR_01179 [Photinus pyralis]KAB0804391.1 hypothetical protein PPYR_01361 [Photinus pyralis]
MKYYSKKGRRIVLFLVAERGLDNQKILIFGRESWLPFLQAVVWYADGTFSIAPSLFHQVYVIPVKRHGGVLPVIYAVLPNKRRTTYNLLFETLKELVQKLNPGSICCDFESAAFTAMQQNFDGVTLKGCFFHLEKNMKHKLSQLGLLRRYANEVQFALHAKRIVAVAFVPLEHIDAVIL